MVGCNGSVICCILLGCLNNSFDQGYFHGESSVGGAGGVNTSSSFDQGSFHGESNGGGVGGVSTSVFVASVLQNESK